MENLNVDQFISDTKVSEADLDEAFISQSSLRAYYGSLAARYEAMASKAKAICEYKEAELCKKYRDKFAEEGVKATEKAIDSAVKLDPAWLKAKSVYIDAECQADIAKSFVSSLVDRKDMLIQLGADRRDDSKGQMRMLQIQQENARMETLRETAKEKIRNTQNNL